MVDWSALREGFDYDLWANRKWAACLEEAGNSEPDLAILGHILAAQRIWSLRCQGTSLPAMPVETVDDATMVELHDLWITHLADRDDDPVISFHRFNGDPGAQPLSLLARHVINHGTYHRGELRGLCRARGVESFPETDYYGYLIWR